MVNKKTDLKRILAISACGTALAGALFLTTVRHNQNNKKNSVRDIAGASYTQFVRDTIDVFVTKEGYIRADDGQYEVFSDIVTRHYFRDGTNSELGKYAVEVINENTKYNDYHELKHAFNSRIMMHRNCDITPDVEAADELSARVAAFLAFFADKKPVKNGKISPRVSYIIRAPYYDLKQVAETVFYESLKQSYDNGNAEHYAQGYEINAALTSEKLPLKTPRIKKQAMIDEFMTFDINGKPVNMLNLVSDGLRAAVYEYVDLFKQR